MRRRTICKPRQFRLITGAWVEFRADIRTAEFLSEEAISERNIDYRPIPLIDPNAETNSAIYTPIEARQ